MKILHITRGLIKTSGISVFVAELAAAQAGLGHDVSVLIRWHPYYPIDSRVRLVEDRRLWRALKRLPRPDVIHIHALWSLHSVLAMLWCCVHGIPFVVSPHGCLMQRVFTHGRLKKLLFWRLLLKPVMRRAQAVHCTGENEVDAVRTLDVRVPSFIAPLGCKLPAWPIAKVAGARKRALFLSRISEEKGLVYLLDAWRRVNPRGWELVLAGPDWKGHRAVLEAKIADESIENVSFTGNADEKMKDQLYRSADLFILPSPMENFSMVVLDALAYGVPVICTKGTPWQVIENRKCGWWVEPNSAAALEKAFLQAMSTSADKYDQMQVRAREVAKEFSWVEIAGKLISGYGEVWNSEIQTFKGKSGAIGERL